MVLFYFSKEMISRLKCNCLSNQEVYDIYEYIICLLILKSWNWFFFFGDGSLQDRFCRNNVFVNINYYLTLQTTLDSQGVNVFIHRGRSYKGFKYLIYSLQLTIISPTKSCPNLKTVTFIWQMEELYFLKGC